MKREYFISNEEDLVERMDMKESKRFNVKHDKTILLRKMKNDFGGHDESNIYEYLSLKCGIYAVEILLEMVFFGAIPICPFPTNARY